MNRPTRKRVRTAASESSSLQSPGVRKSPSIVPTRSPLGDQNGRVHTASASGPSSTSNRKQSYPIEARNFSWPAPLDIHPRYKADGWPEPNPADDIPYLDEHFEFFKEDPRLQKILRLTNGLWSELLRRFKPKARAMLIKTLPLIPVKNLRELIGKPISMIIKTYSPTAIHRNEIGYGNSASAIYDDGSLACTTLGLLNDFLPYAMEVSIFWDLRCHAHEFRGSPTDVWHEEDWPAIEPIFQRYYRDMLTVTTMNDIHVFIASMSATDELNKVFALCPERKPTFFAERQIMHLENLHNKKIRDVNFPTNCRTWDVKCTEYQAELATARGHNVTLAPVTVGRDLIEGSGVANKYVSVDVHIFLIVSYNCTLPYNDPSVPRNVRRYGDKNIVEIRRKNGLGPDVIPAVCHLHRFMCSKGGRNLHIMVKVYKALVEDGCESEDIEAGWREIWNKAIEKHGSKKKVIEACENAIDGWKAIHKMVDAYKRGDENAPEWKEALVRHGSKKKVIEACENAMDGWTDRGRKVSSTFHKLRQTAEDYLNSIIESIDTVKAASELLQAKHPKAWKAYKPELDAFNTHWGNITTLMKYEDNVVRYDEGLLGIYVPFNSHRLTRGYVERTLVNTGATDWRWKMCLKRNIDLSRYQATKDIIDSRKRLSKKENRRGPDAKEEPSRRSKAKKKKISNNMRKFL